MKKILFILATILIATIDLNAQDFEFLTIGKNKTTSQDFEFLTLDRQKTSRKIYSYNTTYRNRWERKYPMDFAFTLGRTQAVYFHNGGVNEYSANCGADIIPSSYTAIGLKALGFVFSIGTNCGIPGGDVLGYIKVVDASYMKIGFELFKYYRESKKGKIESISIAPTYSKISYLYGDTSGNSIGWTNRDNQIRRNFYNENPTLHALGAEISYTQDWYGVNLNIGLSPQNLNVPKFVFELSLLVQLDVYGFGFH